MAEYVRFRFKAAKVGVTMAFLALLGGLSEKARANPPQPKASSAAVDAFLKLKGLQGEARDIRGAFLKIEAFANKLENSFLKLDHKLGQVYSKNEVNAEFLKIKSANTTFLKIDDANAKFLKLDGTSANSSELGGMTPDKFVQGNGSVVSGAVTLPIGGNAQTLLQVPGTNGEIIVVCTPSQTGGPSVTISINNNGTGTTIPGVQSVPGVDPTAVEFGPGSTTLAFNGAPITFINGSQLTLQTFPAGTFNEVVTLTISVELVGNNIEVVGQALNGGT
jgi:hypothetical protein